MHDPGRSEDRRRAARAGGKSKPRREIAGVKTQLQEMVDQVLSGELGRADAAVAGQLLNIKLRALEAERKQQEIEEIEARLAALEASNDGRRQWGA